MIYIKNNLIPFNGYKAINLFGIIFTHKELNDKEKNHEKIHTLQMIECFVIGFLLISFIIISCDLSFLWLLLSLLSFYIFYGLEYLIIRFFHKKQNNAYHDISFEEEAFNCDDDLNYIKKRIPFNWIKYIKLHTNKK